LTIGKIISIVKHPTPAYRQAGSLGESAIAGQKCPAYRVLEIAAFIPARGRGIL